MTLFGSFVFLDTTGTLAWRGDVVVRAQTDDETNTSTITVYTMTNSGQ